MDNSVSSMVTVMNENFQMSPLARVLVGVLQKGSLVAAVLLLLFAAILVFQRWMPDGSFVFQQGDFAFLGILAALLVLAVYLVRAINKELKNPGG
jgi:hypothetical protein